MRPEDSLSERHPFGQNQSTSKTAAKPSTTQTVP